MYAPVTKAPTRGRIVALDGKELQVDPPVSGWATISESPLP
jgi:hypothetical protein